MIPFQIVLDPPNTNAWITSMIGDNWILLYIIWSILNGMFPTSKLLSVIGLSVSRMFPVFRQNKS